MPTAEIPTLPTTVTEAIEERLRSAPAPLNIKAVCKGIKIPKRKPAEVQADIQTHLDDLIRSGRFFASPTGKNQEVRYWHRDEKQFLREAALDRATIPLTLADLNKQLKTVVAGADAKYVESLIRELIGEEQLFEHPPIKGKTPRFGASSPPPPTPPLELEANRKAVEKLIGDCRKLLTKTGASEAELLGLLQRHLLQSHVEPESPGNSIKPVEMFDAETPSEKSKQMEIEELILKILDRETIIAIPELRSQMPSWATYDSLDQAILALADHDQIIVHQDADVSSYSESERSQFVQDGAAFITSITRRI